MGSINRSQIYSCFKKTFSTEKKCKGFLAIEKCKGFFALKGFLAIGAFFPEYVRIDQNISPKFSTNFTLVYTFVLYF